MGTIKNIFDVYGRAMAAQMIRLNTVASNLANANNISSTSEGAYRPLKPIFRTIYSDKLHDKWNTHQRIRKRHYRPWINRVN